MIILASAVAATNELSTDDVEVITPQRVQDPTPLNLIQFIGVNGVTIVIRKDVGVEVIQYIGSQRFSGFHFCVGASLKVCK